MGPRKTLAEQLALASNPEPQDFDPEDFENADPGSPSGSDDSEDSDDEHDKTSHYMPVGRSNIRDDGIALSEGKYKGSRVSRGDMNASSDEDDSEDEEDDEEQEQNNKSEGPKAASGISQILSAEQKTLLNRLNTESNGDVEKGKSVSAQMKIYEGLLDLRIQTQKILNETNTLSASQSVPAKNLYPLISKVLQLRKSVDNDEGQVESANLSELATESAQLDEKLRKKRESVLTKWSRKVELSSGRNALQSSNLRSLGQSSALQVNTVLNDMPRLIKRTQVDRSSYNLPEDSQFLFDDTDFYRLLLKDLVDRRMADGASGTAQGIKWKAAVTKQKKKVDSKASKGRKLKYTIMEKIQGFDAPRHVYSWSDKQAEDLYSGLLGVHISMDDNENAKPESGDAEPEVEIGDFNLFG